MRTPRPVMAACALLATCILLVVGGCATPRANGGATTGNTTTEAHPNSDAGAAVSRFGSIYRFDSGLVVTVSEPTSFQPSDSAYPPSESAIAFRVTVRNETSHRYRLSDMSVTVIADQREAKQLTDPTQGYTGLVSSPEGLPTDCEKQVDLAFAVPAKLTHLKFILSPQKGHPAHVTYVGRMPGAAGAAR